MGLEDFAETVINLTAKNAKKSKKLAFLVQSAVKNHAKSKSAEKMRGIVGKVLG